MIQFLEDLTGQGKKPLSDPEREELETLRREQARIKAKISKQKKPSKDSGSGSGSEEESKHSGAAASSKKEEKDSSDDVSILLSHIQRAKRRMSSRSLSLT